MIVYHFAAKGVPVYVHIGGTHKNRYLQPFVFKIFRINYFFYYYHFAVSGSNYRSILEC